MEKPGACQGQMGKIAGETALDKQMCMHAKNHPCPARAKVCTSHCPAQKRFLPHQITKYGC